MKLYHVKNSTILLNWLKVINFICLFIFSISYCFSSEEVQPYERIVSLGSFCQTKYQINQHLNETFGYANKDPVFDTDHSIHNYWGGGQLFDWVEIYDYELLALAIGDNLSDIFSREHLTQEPDQVVNPAFVANRKTKITFNHLFKKSSDKPIEIDLEYKELSLKVDYLRKKFLDLKNFKTLYTISVFKMKTPCKTITDSTLLNLSNNLSKSRGNNNFSILITGDIDICGETSIIKVGGEGGTIFKAKIEPASEDLWSGSRQNWKEVLDQIPLKATPKIVSEEQQRQEIVKSDTWGS